MEKHLTVPIAVHLAAALPALALGAAILFRRKGTRAHKTLGKVWAALMVLAALSSFWILELRHGAGLSWIHALSAWTLVSLGCALYCIRQGNVRAHQGFMAGTYAGLLIAGLAALAPSRFLAQWVG
jgi:uncharacterized membrane protein